MKMDKVVLNSIISTLCAIALLCGVAFGLAAWLYPSTMMKISYAVGDDVGAMKYAYRAYETTDELYYVAFATEVAIGMDEPEDVEYYAEKFIAESEKFDEYCAEIDRKHGYEEGKYKSYVCGRLTVAKYELGEIDEAKTYAFSTLNGGFSENNAVVALLFAARQNKDANTVKWIVDELKSLTVVGEKDTAYLNSLLAAFDKLN
jgi:hypothetical protein